MRPAILALALMAGSPGHAVEFIATSGRLTDTDFYRLVSCAAAPGQDCIERIVRWPDRTIGDLRVVLDPVHPDYPKGRAKEMLAALDMAIAALNDSGAAIRLRRVPTGHAAPLRLYLTPAGDGGTIRGTGVDSVDGEVIGAGLTTVWWNDVYEITKALIVMADDLPSREIYPVMLEELTQSMGLLTDIRNPLYDRDSVFSEDSNSVRQLGEQDIMALRRHYP